MTYQDFIIRVRDFQVLEKNQNGTMVPTEDQDFDSGDECRFKVEIIASPVGRMARAKEVRIVTQDFSDLSFNEHDLRVSTERRREDTDLVKIGAWLADRLLPKEVLFWLKASLFQTLVKGKGLRLVLWLDDPQTASLPWEYLYVPLPMFETGFLALNPATPIIRDQPFFGRVPTVQRKPRRDVMLAIAEPEDLGDLDRLGVASDEGEERREIRNEQGHTVASEEEIVDDLLAVRLNARIGGNRHIALHQKLRLTEKDLEDAEQEVADGRLSYDMFYFYGHGAFGEEDFNLLPRGLDRNKGYIALEAEQEDGRGEGLSHWYPADKLALKLRRMGVQVAVLSACKTARRKRTQTWVNTVPTLMEKGRIPVVIGMQYRISKLAAFTFALRFFDALAEGNPLEQAVTLGRIEVWNRRETYVVKKGRQEIRCLFSRDWGLPVLYRNARDEIDFSASEEMTQETSQTLGQQELGASPYSIIDTRDFVGRDWVFEEIDAWLVHPDRPRVFRITGPSGCGKSTLAMRLVQISEGIVDPPAGVRHVKRGFLGAAHFCSQRHSTWNAHDVFGESLALQLAAQSRTYASTLKDIFEREGEDREAMTRFVRDSFNTLVEEGVMDEVVILIDALDEAEAAGTFMAQASMLPAAVRFIVTEDETWSNPYIMQDFSWAFPWKQVAEDVEERRNGTPLKQLDEQEQLVWDLSLTQASGGEDAIRREQEDDIRAYVQARIDAFIALKAASPLSKPVVQDLLKEAEVLKDVVVKSSEGLFLIVVTMLEWLEGELEHATKYFQKLNDNPGEGLDRFYRWIIDHAYATEWELHGPVLGTLAVAQEPLTAEQVARFTRKEVIRFIEKEQGASGGTFRDADTRLVQTMEERVQQTVEERSLDKLGLYLQQVKSLLAGRDTYTIYHHSLSDFLLTRKRAGEDFFLKPEEQHARIAEVYWTEWVTHQRIADVYGRNHLARHLYEASEYTYENGARGRDRLQQLISPAWRASREAARHTCTTFLDDVTMAWQVTEDTDVSNVIRLGVVRQLTAKPAGADEGADLAAAKAHAEAGYFRYALDALRGLEPDAFLDEVARWAPLVERHAPGVVLADVLAQAKAVVA